MFQKKLILLKFGGNIFGSFSIDHCNFHSSILVEDNAHKKINSFDYSNDFM